MKEVFFMKKRQIILVAIAVVAFIGIALSHSKALAQRIIGFPLPSSATIQKSKLSLGGSVYVKAIFSPDDFNQMIASLEHYYGDYDYDVLQQNEIIPNFVMVCSWWDMNNKDIKTAYHAFTSGKLVKTKELYSFIVVDQSGNYLLYVAH